MIWVGAIRPDVPRAMPLPSPASTWPRGPRGSIAPNWNWARRDHGHAGQHVLAVDCLHESAGAMIGTLPGLTSASSITPRTPP